MAVQPTTATPDSDAQSWTVEFNLNGTRVKAQVHPTELLYDTLRERFRLTGTKGACLEGECGSCTVLVDGVPMNACLILTPQVLDCAVVTIEGLAQGDVLHPLQETFIEFGAVQCGYCTPGLLVMGKSLLDRSPNPGVDEVLRALEGNICRCTGYEKIIQAVIAAVPGCKARALANSQGKAAGGAR